MKRSIPSWQMAGFMFTSILGTLLHFLFDWTNGSIIAALFSAVNESIWEHMKLLYYPMLLFALVEHRFWGREQKNFWCVKWMGMLAGLTLVPVLYYSYTGALGVEADWFNIAIFFLAAGFSFWLETRLFQKEWNCHLLSGTALALLLGIGVLFLTLTFLPPKIPLFRDPVTGSFGFQQEGTVDGSGKIS